MSDAEKRRKAREQRERRASSTDKSLQILVPEETYRRYRLLNSGGFKMRVKIIDLINELGLRYEERLDRDLGRVESGEMEFVPVVKGITNEEDWLRGEEQVKMITDLQNKINSLSGELETVKRERDMWRRIADKR